MIKIVLVAQMILSATALLRPVSEAVAFDVRADEFTAGSAIPRKYSCDGVNLSPALSWSHPPPGTVAFALIVDDPDAPAGTWVHWVVYDLPGRLRKLEAGDGNRGSPGTQGVNDFRSAGYGGPCPPPGKDHRYFFKLYALDNPTGLKAGASKRELLGAMKGHVLGQAQTWGTYKR